MEQKKFYQRFLLIFILIPFCLFTGCESHPANDLAEDLAHQIEDIDDKTEEEEEEEKRSGAAGRGNRIHRFHDCYGQRRRVSIFRKS
ncbi:hypothetical protein ACU8V7_18775 [Zobellia nedashkovskayae]